MVAERFGWECSLIQEMTITSRLLIGNIIFNIPFHNTKGGFLYFVQRFIGDNDLDMVECVGIYEDVN